MVILRILLHAGIAAVLLATLDAVFSESELPLLHALLAWLSPGHFLVFSLTLACLLNRRPLLLVVFCVLGFIGTFSRFYDPGPYLFAILLGVAAALVANALFREAGGDEE